MSTERYDSIGIGYDETRKADPYLAERMFQLIRRDDVSANYLDVGCGTGNYTAALANKGLHFTGMDPSSEMLRNALAKNDAIKWIQGAAESIPSEDSSIDGVLVCLSIHHWTDLVAGFKEIQRVLKPGGKMVLFTTLPEQTLGNWLNHYFPVMIQDSIDILPTGDQLKHAFGASGLEVIKEEKYYVQPDLQDWFLYCGKHRPELYFKEEVRRGISSFSLLSNRNEVSAGLQQLKEDISSGRIEDIIAQHANELGDYLFIVAEKP